MTNPVSRKPVTAVVAFIPTLVVTNGLSQSRTPRAGKRVLVVCSRLVGAALDMSGRTCKWAAERAPGYPSPP